jgi:hypothetical protein
MRATLANRLAKIEAALGPAPTYERGRSFIVDGDKVVDQDTGKEPDPETLRKIRAGERTGPFDIVCMIVASPTRA